MSRNTTQSDGDDATASVVNKPDVDRQAARRELATALHERGTTDAHIVSRETAEKLLRPQRHALLTAIRDDSPATLTELAAIVDRDPADVSRDIRWMVDRSLVELDDQGRSKRPTLTHDRIVAEPVL